MFNPSAGGVVDLGSFLSPSFAASLGLFIFCHSMAINSFSADPN